MNLPIDHDAREDTILAAARDTRAGESSGVVRRRFLEAVGRSDLIAAALPQRSVKYQQMTDGRVILTFVLRSAVDLRFLWDWAGMGPDLFRLPQMFLADPTRRRARHREAETIARALAIHYLSVRGGGRLTLIRAAAVYQAAGLPWRDTWAPERRRVVREIERDIGPLWLSPGEHITGA